jgi:hypothetical protein
MGRAGIALPRATAAKLAINASCFVTFSANNVQPADIGDAGAKFDIRSTASHVGGNCDRAPLACARHDLGFLLVILGIQHRMNDPFALEHAR